MKAHLATSDEPIALGRDQLALCGTSITKAEPLFMWDDSPSTVDMMDAVVSAFQICSKCLKMPLDQRYIYGIVHGSETR